MNNSDDTIDIVIPWVDGGDIEWQKERNRYAGKEPEDLAEYRYRDWELLKYWFRGIEKYAPWVNKVYFVTNGQKPEWLNLECKKLVWVKHEDYIPKEWLPTFNSHTIEHNLHRIKGLSEKFVLFNDDCFILSPMKPVDFFKDGKPQYIAGLDTVVNPDQLFSYILLNNTLLINRHFDMKKVISKNKKLWFNLKYGKNKIIKTMIMKNFAAFPGFVNNHMPVPIIKSTIEEIWNIEQSILENTCKHKFRNKEDVNQYIYRIYDTCRGNFEPRSAKKDKYFEISSNNDVLCKAITEKKYQMICINDTKSDFNFEDSKNEINRAFEKILTEKCSFEK